jgi:protein-S-isoprenylcysteine O-methyltransferase Ste14
MWLRREVPIASRNVWLEKLKYTSRRNMLTVLRHLLSILLLPFMAVVIVPSLLLTGFAAIDSRWADAAVLVILARLAVAALTLVGFGLFGWCVSLFARVGQGTLAPWDPTKKIVVIGPYQFVRNPMISGVAGMLFGQALFHGSWVVGLWACIFVTINHVYFLVSEEPGLEARCGESYRVYKANVPRWIPRVRPWTGE